MLDIEELPYIDYLIYRRDAFIHKMNNSKEGQEYLENAWRLTQTKPDRSKLREKIGKEH